MKVALVHDFLNAKMGGAEYLFIEMAKLYPDAPIYTLVYNPELYDGLFDPKRIRTSYLQRLPAWLKQRSRYLLPLIPTAIEQFDLSEYDVVLSSSNAFSKGVITKPETLHVSYCNSPMRFVWDYWPRYVQEQHVGPIRAAAIHVLTSRLRQWDYYSASRVDRWIANSHTVAARIRKYYRQEADAVIYPGADLSIYADTQTHPGDYYVTLGSLTPYKKIDLAIEACNQLGRKLVVISDGSDRARLEALAGPTITFVGRVTDTEKVHLLTHARGLIFPAVEDFGIAPIEAMAAGIPVIAYSEGGLTETVVDGKTGVFHSEQTADAVAGAIRACEASAFKPSVIRAHAATFDRATFRRQLTHQVDKWYHQHVAAK